MSFKPDANIQKVAEAYANDAVDFARNLFKVQLDWTEQSIEKVESVLAIMHQKTLTDKPTEEQIYDFAKGFGSYIGEVYRRLHGGEWGIVTLEGEQFPGMSTKTGVEFWPWGRVQNRIVDGAENNVWHYYQLLLPESAGLYAVEKKSFWKRITGT